MRLREDIWIHASPERVFCFFERMEQNYTGWHPGHRTFRWLDGDGPSDLPVGPRLKEGARFRMEEFIGGKEIGRTMVFTRVIAGRHLEFAPANRLIRLVMPSLAFGMIPEDDGCRFRAEIRVRTGPMGAWLNRREFEAVRRHMSEECRNLKRILETEEERR